MIHEYQTGRSVCSFVEFCAWAGVIIGGIMVLAALGTSSRGGGYTFALAGVVPALNLVFFSFVLVTLTQMARATMDGSVAAQKNVLQAQKQHNELIRAMRSYSDPAGSGGSKPSLGDLGSEKSAPAPAEVTDEYKGHRITEEGGYYRVHGIPFATLDLAHAHIDNIAVGSVQKLQAEPERKLSDTEVSYNGYIIETANNIFTVGGKSFGGMSLAKDHIDQLIARKNR